MLTWCSRVALLALVVSAPAAACGRPSVPAGGARAVQVVAGFYPLEEAARRVGGDRVAVDNLTAPGREPHDLELTTSQVAQVQDADLVLFLGEGFQPSLEAAVGRLPAGRALDLLEGGEVRQADGGVDPHVWLDPVRFGGIVEEVTAALVERDPDGRDGYRSRAAAYRQELDVLHGEYQSTLARCRRRLLVTSHDAFGYLAGRYGLEVRSVAGLSPESEPDPARLAELTDLVERSGATTVFTETLVSPRIAEALAREAGVSTAVLNPLEGLTVAEQRRGETYASLMRQNLAIASEALACR